MDFVHSWGFQVNAKIGIFRRYWLQPVSSGWRLISHSDEVSIWQIRRLLGMGQDLIVSEVILIISISYHTFWSFNTPRSHLNWLVVNFFCLSRSLSSWTNWPLSLLDFRQRLRDHLLFQVLREIVRRSLCLRIFLHFGQFKLFVMRIFSLGFVEIDII